MPMKMGIHSAFRFTHSAFLDSRLRGNDEFWGTSFSEGVTVMPMKMGIHSAFRFTHSAFLDSRLRGNDGFQEMGSRGRVLAKE